MPRDERQVIGFIEKLLDVEALIMEEPRTAQAIIEITGYKSDTIYKYLDKGCDFGLFFIKDYDPASAPGRRPQPIYAMQTKPFGQQNAPVPK